MKYIVPLDAIRGEIPFENKLEAKKYLLKLAYDTVINEDMEEGDFQKLIGVMPLQAYKVVKVSSIVSKKELQVEFDRARETLRGYQEEDEKIRASVAEEWLGEGDGKHTHGLTEREIALYKKLYKKSKFLPTDFR